VQLNSAKRGPFANVRRAALPPQTVSLWSPWALSPCTHHRGRSLPPTASDLDRNDFRVSVRGVDVEVVRPEVVDAIGLDVLPTFADPSIATQALATVYLVE
jgi:hypothetical protein